MAIIDLTATNAISMGNYRAARQVNTNTLHIAARLASACAFSAASTLCLTIYIHWPFTSASLVSGDGKVAIYRIAALVLIIAGTGAVMYHHLGRFTGYARLIAGLLCATSAFVMYAFVTSASATTIALLFPGICAFLGLSLVLGAVANIRE
jgi:hypothetical protein